MELDERIALWRTEHYSVATRIIGHGVLGTRDTPVDSLSALISHRRFPTLWEARTELTEASPGAAPAGRWANDRRSLPTRSSRCGSVSRR